MNRVQWSFRCSQDEEPSIKFGHVADHHLDLQGRSGIRSDNTWGNESLGGGLRPSNAFLVSLCIQVQTETFRRLDPSLKMLTPLILLAASQAYSNMLKKATPYSVNILCVKMSDSETSFLNYYTRLITKPFWVYKCVCWRSSALDSFSYSGGCWAVQVQTDGTVNWFWRRAERWWDKCLQAAGQEVQNQPATWQTTNNSETLLRLDGGTHSR